MGSLIDVTGQQFGRLVVLERVQGPDSAGYWLCQCDCGLTTIARGSLLRSGDTRSCGCLHKEVVAQSNRETKTIHGGRYSPTYTSWQAMKVRCYLPTSLSYRCYGARGITVCDRWLHSFENFLSDMGERPSDPAGWVSRKRYWSLDRIDPDGNYEPGNCRWATPLQQRHNRRPGVA